VNPIERGVQHLQRFLAGRRLPGARSSPLLILVGGFVLGALVAVLIVPDGGGGGAARITAGTGATSAGAVGGPLGDSSGGAEGGVDEDAAGPGPGVADPGAASSGGDAGTGGAGAGGAAGSSSPGAAAPAAPGGSAGGPVRGVTDDAIKIGVTLLDVGPLRNLGPAFDNGDRQAHFESILEGWRERGLVPVHGRDIQFVYRSYAVLDPAAQRAACVGLVQDEKVFAVIGDSRFHETGAECVARELGTPLVLHDSPSEEIFARTHPNLFAVQMSESRLLRNLVHWADRNGHLKGKKVGIYYENTPIMRQLLDRTVKAELKRLGHELAAEATTDQTLGGPQDAVAVQRFRSAGVDVAMLFTSKAGFMQQAQAQAYKPRYLDSDFLSGTTNTATSTYPPEQFDGTVAMTGLRYGEWIAGMPAPDVARECAEQYERHSGKRVVAEEREAEWVAMNKGCDSARVLYTGIEAAGRALSPASLVAAIQGAGEMPMGIAPPAAFAADRHHGVTSQRTVQWSAACRCWSAKGAFAPLFVP
jgi:ABC-type branched-subunit amino acid transport system substrate-binding protein